MRNSFLAGIFGLVIGLIISTAFTTAAQTTGQGQTPTLQLVGQAKSGDAPGEIRHAIDNLNEAKSHMMNAGGDWGGHKAKAINLANEAIRELNLGVDWAHAHGVY